MPFNRFLFKASLALLCWASFPGGALAVHTEPSRSLLIGINKSAVWHVDFHQRDQVVTIKLRHVSGPDGACKSEFVNSTLFPVFGHRREGPVSLHRLEAEVDGFTVVVDYSAKETTERYWLTFLLPACTGLACAPTLERYRHERMNAHGKVSSGIVVDYRSGLARWLGHHDATINSGLAPVKVLPPSPQFESMGNLFDFSPTLDLPKSF